MEFYYRLFEDSTFCVTSYKGNETHVIIPNTMKVSILFDDLFKGHSEIISVSIPDTVTNIGGFVFDGCTNLKEIKLPPKLINLWQYAMTRCGIESITIPGNVPSIVPFTFYQCKDLKEVYFNEGTTKICAWAFKDCTSLKTVYLSKSLTDISKDAFEGCEDITLKYY